MWLARYVGDAQGALYLAFVADNVARPDAQALGFVGWVVELANFQRKTAATNTAIEIVSHALHHRDPLVQRLTKPPANLAPIRFCRRPPFGQAGHDVFDLINRQTDLLRDQDERQSANIGPFIAPLIAFIAIRGQQTLAFIEPDGGD